MKEKNKVNEEKLSALMNSTVSGISASDKLRYRAMSIGPAKAQPNSLRPKWAFGLAAAATLAVFSLVALYPRRSEASALRRMQDAISNAQSMQVSAYVGKDQALLQQIYYQNGEWLMHSRLESSHPVWSLVKNDQFYKWDEGQTVATIEPYAEPVWMAHDGTAVDFVKSQMSFDEAGLTSKLEPNPDLNGRPTYKLVIERHSDPRTPAPDERCEVLVDKQTDLPITSTTTSKAPEGGDYVNKEDFAFNVTMDSHMFEPCHGQATLLRNLPAERTQLKAAWSTPLTTATQGSNTAEVRDVEVNGSGTVTIAYTTSLKLDPASSSTAFAPTELRDENGTTYLRLSDYTPGFVSSFADDLAAEMTFGQHHLAFCTWAPLEPRQPQSSLNLEVEFQTRTFTTRPNVAITTSGNPVNVTIAAKPFAGDYPDYSVPLWLRYRNDNQAGEIEALRTAYNRSHRS